MTLARAGHRIDYDPWIWLEDAARMQSLATCVKRTTEFQHAVTETCLDDSEA